MEPPFLRFSAAEKHDVKAMRVDQTHRVLPFQPLLHGG